MYQTAAKIPNGSIIDQMARKYMYRQFPLKDPTKFTHIRTFGFKNIPSGNPGVKTP
jgi:hypothetical protein